MNVTLTHLFLINVCKSSPFFISSKDYLSTNSYFHIEKSSFKNFFNSFYYSSFIQPGKHFLSTSTLFQQFLSSALCFDHTYLYSNETLDSRRLSFIIGSVNISYCKFRLCLGSTKNSFGSDMFHSKGGAIFSLANLSIHQCLFEHNSAARGGSIYCSGELNMKSVTFEGGFSDESQGFINENCELIPLSIEFCLFFNLESNQYTCFSRLSSGPVSIIHNNISTNSARLINAGFYISDVSNFDLKYCILFELFSVSETSILMINCGKSEIYRTLFWYIKSSTNIKNGSTCLSFYDTNSICYLKECSFLICSPGNSKLLASRGESQIIVSGGCSTGSKEDFNYQKSEKKEKNKKGKEKSDLNDDDKQYYRIVIDEKSRFNDQCEDRYVIYASNPYGYYTKNEEIELATKKTDIYEGFFIGVLGLIIVIISFFVSFTLFYHCTFNFF